MPPILCESCVIVETVFAVKVAVLAEVARAGSELPWMIRR